MLAAKKQSGSTPDEQTSIHRHVQEHACWFPTHLVLKLVMLLKRITMERSIQKKHGCGGCATQLFMRLVGFSPFHVQYVLCKEEGRVCVCVTMFAVQRNHNWTGKLFHTADE